MKTAYQVPGVYDPAYYNDTASMVYQQSRCDELSNAYTYWCKRDISINMKICLRAWDRHVKYTLKFGMRD